MTTVWPDANIVNGPAAHCIGSIEHGSKKDCTRKADELRQRYTSSDNATGTAQPFAGGLNGTWVKLGHSQACFTRAVPANRSAIVDLLDALNLWPQSSRSLLRRTRMEQDYYVQL